MSVINHENVELKKYGNCKRTECEDIGMNGLKINNDVCLDPVSTTGGG